MHNHVGSGNMHNNHILDIWLSILQSKNIQFFCKMNIFTSLSALASQKVYFARACPQPQRTVSLKKDHISFSKEDKQTYYNFKIIKKHLG